MRTLAELPSDMGTDDGPFPRCALTPHAPHLLSDPSRSARDVIAVGHVPHY